MSTPDCSEYSNGCNDERSEKLKKEVMYMLSWFQAQPRAEIAGSYGTIQVTCGDMYSLKRGYINPSILSLWSVSKCDNKDCVIVNPEILLQFYRNGPDQIRSWADSTTIETSTVVILPIQNSKLWDLIVIDPTIKQVQYHRLSCGECQPQAMMQTAMTLVLNTNIDPWWSANILEFRILVENYFSQDQNLPTTAICHYMREYSQHMPNVPLSDAKTSIVEIADTILQLINSKLESFCTCTNTESTDLMIACDNPYCDLKWFHLKTCAKLKSVPKGVWYCDTCSIVQ